MRLVLDTNRYVDLIAGVPAVVETIESATELLIPFAVLGELRAGFFHGKRRAANEKTLDLFLAKPFVNPLYADERTIPVYASLYAHLRKRGRSIPTNDLWIASLCVQHAATLYTCDRHFNELPYVPRI